MLTAFAWGPCLAAGLGVGTQDSPAGVSEWPSASARAVLEGPAFGSRPQWSRPKGCCSLRKALGSRGGKGAGFHGLGDAMHRRRAARSRESLGPPPASAPPPPRASPAPPLRPQRSLAPFPPGFRVLPRFGPPIRSAIFRDSLLLERLPTPRVPAPPRAGPLLETGHAPRESQAPAPSALWRLRMLSAPDCKVLQRDLLGCLPVAPARVGRPAASRWCSRRPPTPRERGGAGREALAAGGRRLLLQRDPGAGPGAARAAGRCESGRGGAGTRRLHRGRVVPRRSLRSYPRKPPAGGLAADPGAGGGDAGSERGRHLRIPSG